MRQILHFPVCNLAKMLVFSVFYRENTGIVCTILELLDDIQHTFFGNTSFLPRIALELLHYLPVFVFFLVVRVVLEFVLVVVVVLEGI